MSKFFTTVDKAKPIYDVVYKIVRLICKIMLIADILVTSFAVLGRYVSFLPDPVWSEQVVLTLMVYMSLLSATLAIHDETHIRMTAFDKFIPKRVLSVLDIIADIFVAALGVFFIIYGNQILTSPLAKFGKYESMPWLSRYWMYFPVPLAGGAMVFFELERIYVHLKKLVYPETEKIAEQEAVTE